MRVDRADMSPPLLPADISVDSFHRYSHLPWYLRATGARDLAALEAILG